jgi:TonB family protein
VKKILSVPLALVLGVALGIVGTLIVQRSFQPRTPGLVQITNSAGIVSSPSVHIDGVIQEEQIVQKVYPVYPEAAETANITGTVILHVVIAKDGTVKSVEYLSGPAILAESAKAGVKEYRYKPNMVGGVPVEVDTIVAVPYWLPH